MIKHYYELIPEMKDVNLSDSWVLGFIESNIYISILLEVVISKNHHLYRDPVAGEARCYINGELNFFDLKQVDWRERKFVPAVGLNGEKDYGNIDSMIWYDDAWHLEGEWGSVSIKCGRVCLNLE